MHNTDAGRRTVAHNTSGQDAVSAGEPEADVSGIFQARRRPGLDGRRFAVKIEDDSLWSFGVPAGHIVLALRGADVGRTNPLAVIDHFEMGVLVGCLTPDSRFKNDLMDEILDFDCYNLLGHVIELNPTPHNSPASPKGVQENNENEEQSH